MASLSTGDLLKAKQVMVDEIENIVSTTTA